VSGIPEETRKLMQPSTPGGIEILIVDALRKEKKVNSHYSLVEAIEEARLVKAKKTYLSNISSIVDDHKISCRNEP
jgi:hypothetical protein